MCLKLFFNNFLESLENTAEIPLISTNKPIQIKEMGSQIAKFDVHSCNYAFMFLGQTLQIYQAKYDNVTYSRNPPMVKGISFLSLPKNVFDKKYPSSPQNFCWSITWKWYLQS